MSGSRLALAMALALALPSRAQAPAAMLELFSDREARYSIQVPRDWRREQPGGPTRLVFAEPAGPAFILCSIEHAAHRPRLDIAQARLDRDLVAGFRTRAWPQQLAGKREVLDFAVREVGGVPMGGIDWERTDSRDGIPVFARGLKLFRATPAALWSAECAAIGESKSLAEAHFARNLALIGEILGSVRFPR